MKKRLIALTLLAIFVTSQVLIAAPLQITSAVAERLSDKTYVSEEIISATEFDINTDVIDEMFFNAEDVSEQAGLLAIKTICSNEKLSGSDPWVAWALSLIPYFTGIAGIHRLYLGAGAGVFLAYFFTFGGCGFVSLIDTIILLIGALEGDVSKYEGSKKCFMW